MQDIITSASKIVFILTALTVCIAFLFEVFTGRVTLDTKDFIPLVAMAFTFYFAAKPNDPNIGATGAVAQK